jgi:hypothetical protein
MPGRAGTKSRWQVVNVEHIVVGKQKKDERMFVFADLV